MGGRSGGGIGSSSFSPGNSLLTAITVLLDKMTYLFFTQLSRERKCHSIYKDTRGPPCLALVFIYYFKIQKGFC